MNTNQQASWKLLVSPRLSGREWERTDSSPTAYSPINQSSSAKVATIVSELKLGEARE